MVGRSDLCAVLALLLGACACPARADAPNDSQLAGTPLADVRLNDAQLCDVAFVDAQNGWAVGDRGAIWHTADGGRRWTLQTSGIDCRLTAVRFLDERHGFTVGGRVKPYSQTTAGVLLETRDGGEHWQQDRKLLLPALRNVAFFDARRGCAVGERSALFPTGVFTTDDGGRSWSALAADDGQCWLSGDFSAPAAGIVVGRSGAVATVRGRQVEPRTADVGWQALHRVRLAGPREAWLVGDGGMVRHSADGGESWQPPPGELPPQARQFDFLALAVRKEHCWLAGVPGTLVFHSADAGHTWQVRPTGQPLPIRGLTFVDEQHGWAVGDLGVILATSDGGQSWQRQRAGGGRAALAAFCSRAGDAPLELVARLAGEEGYLSIVEAVNRQDLDGLGGQRLDPAGALHDAVVRAGGSGAEVAWQFPVRDPELKLTAPQLIAPWDALCGGLGLDALDEHLVRQLRVWRPSVVVVPDTGPGAEAAALLVAQSVLQAVDRAAESEHWPAQIEAAGLQPWKVEKIFAALPPGAAGPVSLSTAQLSPRSGRSVAEVAATARGLMAAEFAPPPTMLGFRLLVDRLPQERGARDFFAGIVLAARSDARRALVAVSDASLDRVRQTTETRRNLQAILGQANRSDAEAGRWLAEVGQFTQSLDTASASELLFQLAWRYYQSGRWELAVETFEMIPVRYPDSPLAPAALVWLVQYYSSGEATWRVTKNQQIGARQVTALEPVGPKGRQVQRIPTLPPGQVVQQGVGLIASPNGPQTWPARAAALAAQLEKVDPSLLAEPRVRFPLAVAERRGGQARQAEKFYSAARRGSTDDPWAQAAALEGWLDARSGTPPKETVHCSRAGTKPKLDGRLDDPLWQQAERLELHSPLHDDDDWPTVMMLACDDEYLYWAASCRRVTAGRAGELPKARQRDADLAATDRIELCLDLDRDWTTYYRLQVDAQGRTHESCWGDASWNPQWFVAAHATAAAWTVEAAIPLVELARERPAAGQAWAIGLTRIVPGAGLQSLSKPAGAAPIGAGFACLLFE